MDFEPLLEFLQPHLPPFAFHLLLNFASSLSSAVNTLVFAITHPSDPDAVDALKSLVPSILSFLALYFTVMSVYRTLRSTIRLAMFFVKWVGILAALGLGITYLMSGGSRNDFSDLTAQFNKFESNLKDHATTPTGAKTGSQSVWDRFDARERGSDTGEKLWWRKNKEVPPAARGSAIDYVFEQVASYKWVVDSLLDTKDDVVPEKGNRPGRTKPKPRTNLKGKGGQRVR